MKTAMFRLFQLGFAIFLLAIAFWPWWGLAYWAFANAATSPFLVVVLGAVWIMLMALNLPLTRRQFQVTGAICFIALIITLLIYIGLDVQNSNSLIIAGIFSVGFLIGWFTISSFIWRWYRGVYGVDDADTGADGE
jgi:hypothetical protein